VFISFMISEIMYMLSDTVSVKFLATNSNDGICIAQNVIYQIECRQKHFSLSISL
jgi:hypothetical protein